MNKRNFLIGLLSILPLWLWSQTDTLLHLPVIEVVEPSIREQTIGAVSLLWTTQQLQESTADNIADLFSAESTVFIKSYSGNSLATSSVRGGSAGHTLVLWNGLPIQSPMLGLLDLSLLPIASAERVRFQKGGSSALWGSGAIGGVLALDNAVNFDLRSAAQIDTRIGAFGEWRQQGQLRFGNAKLQSVTKISHQQADNDFWYTVTPGLPKRQQSNAAFEQQNYFQDVYWSINDKQQLSVHAWHQRSERQLPPLTTQTRSLAEQDDQSTRLLLDWELRHSQSLVNAKLGWFDEKLDYYDEAIGLVAKSGFQTWIAEAEGQRAFGAQHIVTLGGSQQFTQAQADGYTGNASESRSDGFLSYKFQQGQSVVQASLRQSIIKNNFAPIVPSLGLDYHPGPRWRLHLKVSRNYRWPTLNDRFWQPGGNPDLRAEQGWSQELGLHHCWAPELATLKLSVTAFNKNIDDWILWRPQEGQAFWSASNIAKVWSRGLESSLQYEWQKSDWTWKLRFAYDYIRSTNEVALQLPRIQKGTQLPYTPEHQALGQAEVQYKNWQIKYAQHYTGVSQGVNEKLPGYQTASVQVNYRWQSGPYEIYTFLALQNIWNTDYQVIERRPMPGRHGQVGMHLSFKKYKP